MPAIGRLLLAAGGALALIAAPALAEIDAPDQRDAERGAGAERGAQVFASHGCSYCHESGGRSAGKGPQLMGTKRDDSFIRFRVMNGKEGRMPSFSGSIDADQLTDLIAYIRSLKD